MKIILTSLLVFIHLLILFINQNPSPQEDIVGAWMQLPKVSKNFMIFKKNGTFVLTNSLKDTLGNLANEYTYKVYNTLEGFRLSLYLTKENETRDSIFSKVDFLSHDSIKVTTISNDKKFVDMPLTFIRILTK